MKELTRITKTWLKDDCSFRPFSSSYLRSSFSLSVPLFVLQRIRSSGRYAKHHLLICGNQVFENQIFSFPWLKHSHNIKSFTALWQPACVVEWAMRRNRVLTWWEIWLKPFSILLVHLSQACSLWRSHRNTLTLSKTISNDVISRS